MIKHRTKEWFEARIGKFTASCFGKLMAKPADRTATWSKSALNCVEKAVSQQYYNRYYERPDNNATRWGFRNESLAIEEFVRITNFRYKETGFVLHPTIQDIGATPDAQIIEDESSDDFVIAQIKCPYNTDNHLKYASKIFDNKTLKKSKSEYYWQMQGEIWITGAKHNYFVSFDPRLQGAKRLHYAKIERDNDAIRMLKQRIYDVIELKNKFLNEIEQGIRRPEPLISLW